MPAERRARQVRKLNVLRIKQVIVMIAGAVTAIGSVVTGLAGQVAFAPMLTWMLGFSAEKAQATALRFSVVAALTGVVDYYMFHAMPGGFGFVLRALCVAFGAIIGAVVGAPISATAATRGRFRFGQTLGVGLTLFILLRTARLTMWESPHIAHLGGYGALLLIGVALGVLTQATALASGILMVPTLYYLVGLTAVHAVTMSLLVAVSAAALPLATYGPKGLTDRTYGLFADCGGFLGGIAGGILLGGLTDRPILLTWAAISMFLCARQIALTPQ